MTRSIACYLIGCLMVVTGCRSMGVSNPFGPIAPAAPTVLAPTASAAEIVAAVNANAARIQTYQAPSASISMPQSAGLPLVQASIAAEQPGRFRLRATTALSGPEFDLGSNDERFWIWARRNDPPALFTARHAEWAASPQRGMAPIEPAWIVDAIGMTRMDPALAYSGPVPRDDGSVELRALVPGAGGQQQRVWIIDAQTAQVRTQHVYDAAGRLAATVEADRFRYDATHGISIPERIRLNVPDAELELTINTGPVTLNAPVTDAGGLWMMPQLGDTPVVNLANPGVRATASNSAWGQAAPPQAAIATPFGSSPATPAAAQPPTMSVRSVSTPIDSASAAPGFVGLPTRGRALD